MITRWDKYHTCAGTQPTLHAKDILVFKRSNSSSLEELLQNSAASSTVSFLLIQVCAQHISLEKPQVLFLQRSQDPANMKSQDELQVSSLRKFTICTGHRSSMEKHTQSRPPFRWDNPFCVQKLPPVLTQNPSLSLQKVLHVQNTSSKFIFSFTVFIVPSSLLLSVPSTAFY